MDRKLLADIKKNISKYDQQRQINLLVTLIINMNVETELLKAQMKLVMKNLKTLIELAKMDA